MGIAPPGRASANPAAALNAAVAAALNPTLIDWKP